VRSDRRHPRDARVRPAARRRARSAPRRLRRSGSTAAGGKVPCTTGTGSMGVRCALEPHLHVVVLPRPTARRRRVNCDAVRCSARGKLGAGISCRPDGRWLSRARRSRGRHAVNRATPTCRTPSPFVSVSFTPLRAFRDGSVWTKGHRQAGKMGFVARTVRIVPRHCSTCIDCGRWVRLAACVASAVARQRSSITSAAVPSKVAVGSLRDRTTPAFARELAGEEPFQPRQRRTGGPSREV
jgi:hypothetical protein